MNEVFETKKSNKLGGTLMDERIFGRQDSPRGEFKSETRFPADKVLPRIRKYPSRR